MQRGVRIAYIIDTAFMTQLDAFIAQGLRYVQYVQYAELVTLRSSRSDWSISAKDFDVLTE